MRKFLSFITKRYNLAIIFLFGLLISIGLIANNVQNIRDFHPKAAVSSQGPKDAGQVVDTNGLAGIWGSFAWSNPNNAAADDGTYATAVETTGQAQITHQLKANNYNFSIPSGSTINGIEVKVKRKASVNDNALDSDVYLLFNQFSTARFCSSTWGTPINTTEIEVTFGSPQSTCGVNGISASIVNASDFGVAYYARTSGSVTISVDSIRILVYYTPPPPKPTASLWPDSYSVGYNSSTTLHWSSTNATSCTAGGDWSGTFGASGSKPTGNLTSDKYYSISCFGGGGESLASFVNITVGSPPSGGGSSGGGSSGGGSSGGSTTPSPIAGKPSLPPPPSSGKLDPKIVNFLKINLAVPYLAGTLKVPLLIGGFGQEVEVTQGTKDYQIDVRGAKFKLGSQLKIQAGGAHTLLTKKLTIKSKAPRQPVKFGDLWLGDLKVDNQVNFQDTEGFLTSFIEKDIKADVNADSTVNSFDWAIILANFGKRGD